MNKHLLNKALTEDASQLPEFLQKQVADAREVLRTSDNDADRSDALRTIRSAIGTF